MLEAMVSDGSFARQVHDIKIEDEMRASYLDYAMSVIVARALPDVRDGLKPVHRRILYAMDELGVRPGTPYKKSARIVGEVLGKYHPHGDAPVYEAMVRMAQDFAMRYPLIDGQGNFGSIDNDPPAAMRYTEARLAPIALEMLADIDRNTVDFVDNFDGSLREPVVLPARLPNLLVNGSSGIAVGMATNIPPHNLTEVCDAVSHLIENPEATTEELTQIVKGPDFPTAGLIHRYRTESTVDAEGKRVEQKVDAIKEAYASGQGRIVMRARATIEETKAGRHQIVVTELPYQVNKAALIEKIADLVKDKRIDGISDIRDESDRHGMRIVIELRREGSARQILNALYKHTPMQSAFNIHMLALVNGQPRTIGLKAALEHYIDHRRVIIRRRSEHDLEKAREREHILAGLLRAIDQLDAIITLIRRSPSADEAKERLMRRPFNFSDRQAQAILDMQLRRLAALERKKLQDEYAEVIQTINYLEDLLANPRKIDFLIRDETQELKKKFGDERRTRILEREAEDFSEADLVPHQDVVVTLSRRGYIKRMTLDHYRPQRRGGRGITGMVTREADAVWRMLVADTHDSLLFFTDRGRVFQSRVFDIPDATRTAKGIPLINLIDIDQGEVVTAVVSARDFERDCMIMATRLGEVKRTALSEFESVRRSGLIAMDLEDGDELVAAALARESDDVLLVSNAGQAIRFKVTELRQASRQSGGVRGIRLGRDERVVAMVVPDSGQELLTVTAYGFGKRTSLDQYPTQGRGGSGIRTHHLSDKTGELVAAQVVNAQQELMIISRDGVVLRTQVDSIALYGRDSQGVHVMRVGPNDAVASIACIDVARKAEEPSGRARRARAGATAGTAPAEAAPKGARSARGGKGRGAANQQDGGGPRQRRGR